MSERMGNLSIENAKIMFRNFSGRKGKYNAEGDRNFCVILDDLNGKRLEEDGWNVRWLKPRDEDDSPSPYIHVSVKYNSEYESLNPRIYIIGSNKKKTLLDKDTVGMLDWAEIRSVDLIIRPYEWEVNGRSGVKAYVHTMYVTIEEDEFASKYADDIPEIRNNVADDDDVPF